MKTIDFVRESNRIEGITREPAQAEIAEHDRFIVLDVVTVAEMERFVSVYEPGAVLRDREGLNVRVGHHLPPKGSPEIRQTLTSLLYEAKYSDAFDPYFVHCQYERLHPFIDGNGRSGRALWAWQMNRGGGYPLGFLHHFYYQALSASR